MQSRPKWLFEEAQAKPDRDRLEAYINSLGEGFLATDDAGVIEISNSAALNLLSYNKLQGMSLSQAIPIADRSGAAADIMKLIKAGGGRLSSQEHSIKNHDGSLVRVRISVSPVKAAAAQSSGGFAVLIMAIA